tara:strand:+ start:560 stop:790 length:231 start_codon:yes stop_codon:yes gene_type:complete
MNKLKQILQEDMFWFFLVWCCGLGFGLTMTIVPSESDKIERHDAQVSKCLVVAQKWCPTDEKREKRFEWCMKQWTK